MTVIALALRPSGAADEPLLRRIYASTRAEELAPVPWTDAQKAAFLDQQFEAQAAHYVQHYPDVELLVVVADGEDVGRFYVCRGTDEFRVLDIALLPAWRNRGIGTRLLTDFLAEASAGGAFVSLYVEAHNPARRLYERFGFVVVEQGPVYDRLERQPNTAS